MSRLRIAISILGISILGGSYAAFASPPQEHDQTSAEERKKGDKSDDEAAVALERRINEVVNVIGSPDRLTRIPGSAYIIDAEKMEQQQQGYDDVHRMLRQVPGVVIQEEEGYGLRPNIGMRGTGSERSSKITLMEDGVLVAPAPYAAPSAYYFPVAGRMESMEVRKGSSQIKFGPRTNGGVLNLVSTSIPDALRVNVDAAGGVNATGKLYANVGDRYGRVSWMFETYQLRTDGFKELDGGGNTGFHLQDYQGKIQFQTAPTSRVFQQLLFKIGGRAQDDNETYLGITDEDFEENPNRRYLGSQLDNITWDQQTYYARHFLAIPNQFDVTTLVYRNNFARNWYKLQSVAGTGLSSIFADPVANARPLAIAKGADSDEDELQVRANNRTYYGMGVQSMLGFTRSTADVRHDVEVGFRYHEDEEDRFQHQDGYQMLNQQMLLTSAGTPGSQTNRVSDAQAWAFFVQDQIDVGRWSFTPGLRYETIDFTRTDYGTDDPTRVEPTRVRPTTVDAFIPGVGVSFRARADVQILGGVHKGFGPPGPGAPEEARPEESVNFELGTRVRKSGLNTELLFFYNDYGNLLGVDTLATGGTGEGDIFNGGEARIFGVEALASFDLNRNSRSSLSLPLLFSYTYTNAEFQDSFESSYEPWGTVEAGDKLPYLAPHQFFASFSLEQSRWRVGIDANYSASMRVTASQGSFPDRDATDSFLVFNASGEYEVAEDVRVFANLQNIGDAAYIVARRPAGARPGLPRTFLAGIKLSFGR